MAPEETVLLPTPEAEDAPHKPGKGWKVLSIVLFVLSIASVYFGFIGMMLSTSPLRPSVSGLWICFLFLPLPLASLIFGIVAKVRGFRFRKNWIIAYVMIPVLCFLGLLSLSARPYANPIEKAEEALQMDLPRRKSARVLCNSDGTPAGWGTLFYEGEIEFDPHAVGAFEAELAKDPRFVTELSDELHSLRVSLDPEILLFGGAEFYSLYNADTGEYNTLPTEAGTYRFTFVMYDADGAWLYLGEYEYTYEKDS